MKSLARCPHGPHPFAWHDKTPPSNRVLPWDTPLPPSPLRLHAASGTCRRNVMLLPANNSYIGVEQG